MKEQLKKWFFSFVLVQNCITLAMGLIGTVGISEVRVPYFAFFLPTIFAFLSMLPDLVFLSKKERAINETLIIKFVKLVIREVIVLGAQKLLAPSTSTALLIVLGIAVFCIVTLVNLINWLFAKGESNAMNQKLEAYRQQNSQL